METRDIANKSPGVFPGITGYKISEMLGKGGMACVYLAFQEDLERDVAIKILDPVLSVEENIVKRFEYEAKTAAKLIHNNIVTIYNVGCSGNNHYIVMEYLKESLRDRLKRKGILAEEEALVIIKTIASALFYAHGKGIIHRDIKPDNIMFRADGTPVLVDFGIARIIDLNTRLTMTGVRVGTPYYMSPEQCMGEALDGRSDIYSLGVLLFELLTGDVPYKSETPTGVIYLHTQGSIPLFTGDLANYQPLIDRMMAKEKEERIENGQHLIKYIESFESGQLSSKRKDSQVSRKSILRENHQNNFPIDDNLKHLQQQTKRKKILTGSLAIVITILIGIMIYLFITLALKDRQPDINHQEKEIERDQPVQEPIQPATSPDQQKESKTTAPPEKIVKKTTVTPKTREPEKIKKKEPEQKKKDDEDKKVKKKPDEAQEKQVQVKNKKIDESSKNNVKTVNLVDLSQEMIARIDKELKRVEVWYLPEGIIVGGKIEFNLSVNEKGKIYIKQFDDSWLTVNPGDKREIVKNMITKKMNSLSIGLLEDEAGQPIKIENWLKTFKLATFSGKIILH